jgi:hypothetical protein
MVGVPVVMGTAAILARQGWSPEEVPASFRRIEYPVSLDEQVVAVFLALHFRLVFAALFLWGRSVVPGICVHTLVDLGWILVG